jgi:hypothetical protein
METIWQTFVFEHEGRQRKARVTVAPADQEMVFRVIMDDGYENLFFLDSDKWCEKNVGFTELAETIGFAIENHFE